MRRFFPHLFRSTVAGAVAGVIAVVALVAVSSADRLPFIGTPATSVAGDSVQMPGTTDTSDDQGDQDTADDTVPGDPRGLRSRIDALEASTSDLQDSVERLSGADSAQSDKIAAHAKLIAGLRDDATSLTNDLEAVRTTVKELRASITDLSGTVKDMRTTVTDLSDAVGTLKAEVSALKSKTSKLNEIGDYSGPVDPSQFTRKLTPADISGNWPLGRTTDRLESDKLAPPTFGCYYDYRYNTLLAIDPFSKLTCVRILK